MSTEQPVPYPGNRTEPTPDASAVLEALDDETCRHVLNTLRDRHLTAGEISETCDVPQSTTYRKLDLLTDAGLLDSSIRVAPAENNPTEYTTAADGATIRLDPEGGYRITLADCDDTAGETSGPFDGTVPADD
jgi:DNA-binding transcriptional ArsR family regulator